MWKLGSSRNLCHKSSKCSSHDKELCLEDIKYKITLVISAENNSKKITELYSSCKTLKTYLLIILKMMIKIKRIIS